MSGINQIKKTKILKKLLLENEPKGCITYDQPYGTSSILLFPESDTFLYKPSF